MKKNEKKIMQEDVDMDKVSGGFGGIDTDIAVKMRDMENKLKANVSLLDFGKNADVDQSIKGDGNMSSHGPTNINQ